MPVEVQSLLNAETIVIVAVLALTGLVALVLLQGLSLRRRVDEMLQEDTAAHATAAHRRGSRGPHRGGNHRGRARRVEHRRPVRVARAPGRGWRGAAACRCRPPSAWRWNGASPPSTPSLASRVSWPLPRGSGAIGIRTSIGRRSRTTRATGGPRSATAADRRRRRLA